MFGDGMIISNQSLLISNVKRTQMGQYICIAVNAEGEGESNAVYLEVQCKLNLFWIGFFLFQCIFILFFSRSYLYYLHTQIVAPVCRPGQIHTYNVGRGETAKIQCEVMGIPTDINFVWKFNTSVSELLDMPSSIVTNDKTRSTIHFKPMTEHVIIITTKMSLWRCCCCFHSFPSFTFHFYPALQLDLQYSYLYSTFLYASFAWMIVFIQFD
jgi:hypothetical protein